MTAKKSVLERIESRGAGRYLAYVRIMGIAYAFGYEGRASEAEIIAELAHDGYDVSACLARAG